MGTLVDLLLLPGILIRDCVFAIVVLIAFSIVIREGFSGLLRKVLTALRNLYGLDGIIRWFLRREVRSFLKQVDPQSFGANKTRKSVQIPLKGKWGEQLGGGAGGEPCLFCVL